jgi:flagellar basal-body rod protein FlgG
MNRALRTAASGMAAQQMNVEIIANNLANVNTTGFKKSRPEFQDLMYQTLKASGVSQNPNIRVPIEIQVGNGAVPVATLKTFSQGDVQTTNNTLDVAIQGEGFLQVRRPDGSLAYTRDGALKLSADGTLVTSQGYIFEPGITLGSDTTNVTIGRDGSIDVTTGTETNPTKAGQIELAKFVNPAGLRAIGNSLFVETPASGPAVAGTPGTEGFGEVLQGSLESSNVDVVEEMVGMITAQRAYEMNAKTITAVDEMLSTANGIKR